MFEDNHARALLDSTVEGIYGLDRLGLCTFCNVAGLALLGYSDEQEVVGRNMHELIHHHYPDGRLFPEPECPIYQALRHGEPAHSADEVLWRADGSSFPAEYRSHPVAGNGGVVVTFTDISERRALEEELAAQKLRVDLAVAGATDGLWDWEIDTGEMWYAGRFLELLGYDDPAQFPPVIETFFSHLHPEDVGPTRAAVEHHLETDAPYDVEYRLRTRGGDYRRFRARGTCLRDDSGRAVRMAGSIQDVTNRYEILRQLEQANRELQRRSEEVEAFVYIVSHDLRAPLVNIQGFCRELELSCEELRNLFPNPEGELRRILEEDIPGALEFISSSTDRFERLIDALLRLSRTGRRELVFEQLDTERLVKGVVAAREVSLRDSGASLEILPLPEVWGDRTSLEQVFANLIDNALRYLDPDRSGQIVVGGESEGTGVHLWIQDNGLGIPESAHPRLFQVYSRFHPDRAPGEGMGLTIVKRIVERHDGEIWVDSRPGSTTFHLRLPGGDQR